MQTQEILHLPSTTSPTSKLSCITGYATTPPFYIVWTYMYVQDKTTILLRNHLVQLGENDLYIYLSNGKLQFLHHDCAVTIHYTEHFVCLNHGFSSCGIGIFPNMFPSQTFLLCSKSRHHSPGFNRGTGLCQAKVPG